MSLTSFTMTIFVIFILEELSQLFRALIYLQIDSSYCMDEGFATLLGNTVVIWNNFPYGCCTVLQIIKIKHNGVNIHLCYIQQCTTVQMHSLKTCSYSQRLILCSYITGIYRTYSSTSSTILQNDFICNILLVEDCCRMGCGSLNNVHYPDITFKNSVEF